MWFVSVSEYKIKINFVGFWHVSITSFLDAAKCTCMLLMFMFIIMLFFIWWDNQDPTTSQTYSYTYIHGNENGGGHALLIIPAEIVPFDSFFIMDVE